MQLAPLAGCALPSSFLETRSSSCVVVAPGGRRQAPPWWALVAAAPFAGLYSRQISGRAAVTSRLRRAAQKAQATNLRADFERTAPNWSAGTSHLEDDLLLKAWSSSELLQFPRRGRQGTAGLDPKVCVSDLCPEHRLRVWAYLRQLNPHEPSLAAIFAAMDAVPGRQKLRVKELFESCDIVSAIVQWWLRRDRRDGRRVGTRQPERIIDAACGHGLVGMLLSHCFPDSAVCAVDREERKLMPVALSTWAQLGRRLDNFETLRCRQTVGLVEGSLSPSPSTLVVAVHACNQATLDVLDLAAHFGTSWAVVPCCMRKQKYFPGGSSHLERDEHYPVMCGALSARFGADMLHSIDRLISTKNLIIAKRAPRHGYATAAEPGNFLLASSENAHWIQDVTDPLADDFRNLKEPGPQLSREGAFFVVEGPEAIRLLLASDFAVTKLLLKPSLLDSMAEALESRLKRETSAGADAQVMLLLCEAGLMEKAWRHKPKAGNVTGIPAKHASAALAIARRRAPCCLQEIPQFAAGAPFRALALERGLDEESVGALFRVAAAFGVSVVLCDSECGDPFHRRAVRVSMGHVLRVPFVQGCLHDLLGELVAADVQTIAVCDGLHDTGSYLDELTELQSRWACFVGVDGGVQEPLAELCRTKVTVRKALPGVSLGTGVSASIVLNACIEREAKTTDLHPLHKALAHSGHALGPKPFSTGLSAFAALGQDGRETRGGLNGEVVDCPWVLIMRPVMGNMTMVRNPWEPDVPDLPKSLQHMLHLPAGTTLYEVYACPSPGAAFESGWLQLIGRIISASKFIPEPASESLHQLRFRHQRKEEDYVLRPEWLQELNGGHSACGSEHFERLLCRRDKTMAAQGGAFTADPLPNARWVWSVGMKAQGGLSSFPRSISTSAAGDMSSRPTSPGSSARTTSRDSLAAALRQRGGRCSPPAAMMPAPEPSPTNRDQSPVVERSGSCCGGCSFALASTTMVLLIAEPLQRHTSLPAIVDVKTEALLLSRQLHLDFHEVKHAVQELRKEHAELANGGMELTTFRDCVLRAFSVKDIHERLLQDAYHQCKAADGPENDPAKESADALTLELAKKHDCSCIELDKVKLQFDHFDTDKSGLIEYNEFESMMYTLLHCANKSDLPPNRIERFWHEVDLDGNGSVDFTEFTEWYLKYFALAQEHGPIEAFYASFMPSVQRTKSLESRNSTSPRGVKDDAVLGPFFQPSPSEASEGSLKMFTFSILFVAFLFYRTCAKRPGKEEEEEDENWEECFQEAPYLETALRMGHTRPRLMRSGSETWRQDPSREPVLVRGVSAHELLLT
eukprot:s254_g28.t4